LGVMTEQLAVVALKHFVCRLGGYHGELPVSEQQSELQEVLCCVGVPTDDSDEICWLAFDSCFDSAYSHDLFF
jgi:hypothetical protein